MPLKLRIQISPEAVQQALSLRSSPANYVGKTEFSLDEQKIFEFDDKNPSVLKNPLTFTKEALEELYRIQFQINGQSIQDIYETQEQEEDLSLDDATKRSAYSEKLLRALHKANLNDIGKIIFLLSSIIQGNPKLSLTTIFTDIPETIAKKDDTRSFCFTAHDTSDPIRIITYNDGSVEIYPKPHKSIILYFPIPVEFSIATYCTFSGSFKLEDSNQNSSFSASKQIIELDLLAFILHKNESPEEKKYQLLLNLIGLAQHDGTADLDSLSHLSNQELYTLQKFINGLISYVNKNSKRSIDKQFVKFIGSFYPKLISRQQLSALLNTALNNLATNEDAVTEDKIQAIYWICAKLNLTNKELASVTRYIELIKNSSGKISIDECIEAEVTFDPNATFGRDSLIFRDANSIAGKTVVSQTNQSKSTLSQLAIVTAGTGLDTDVYKSACISALDDSLETAKVSKQLGSWLKQNLTGDRLTGPLLFNILSKANIFTQLGSQEEVLDETLASLSKNIDKIIIQPLAADKITIEIKFSYGNQKLKLCDVELKFSVTQCSINHTFICKRVSHKINSDNMTTYVANKIKKNMPLSEIQQKYLKSFLLPYYEFNNNQIKLKNIGAINDLQTLFLLAHSGATPQIKLEATLKLALIAEDYYFFPSKRNKEAKAYLDALIPEQKGTLTHSDDNLALNMLFNGRLTLKECISLAPKGSDREGWEKDIAKNILDYPSKISNEEVVSSVRIHALVSNRANKKPGFFARLFGTAKNQRHKAALSLNSALENTLSIKFKAIVEKIKSKDSTEFKNGCAAIKSLSYQRKLQLCQEECFIKFLEQFPTWSNDRPMLENAFTENLSPQKSAHLDSVLKEHTGQFSSVNKIAALLAPAGTGRARSDSESSTISGLVNDANDLDEDSRQYKDAEPIDSQTAPQKPTARPVDIYTTCDSWPVEAKTLAATTPTGSDKYASCGTTPSKDSFIAAPGLSRTPVPV